MKKIFVDTSGWGNLADTVQEFHEQTKFIYESAKQDGSRFVTTNYVIAELRRAFLESSANSACEKHQLYRKY